MNTHTNNQVEQVVLDHFLSKHEPCTILTLVECTGLSHTHLRNLARANPHLIQTVGQHKIYSVQEPTQIHQTRKVEAYMPSREWLAYLYADARRRAEYWSTARGKFR